MGRDNPCGARVCVFRTPGAPRHSCCSAPWSMSRVRVIRAVLAAAIALSAAALAPAARAGGLDLPIGGSVTPSADPEDVRETGPQPKLYDESIPAVSDSVIYVIDRSASMDLPTR